MNDIKKYIYFQISKGPSIKDVRKKSPPPRIIENEVSGSHRSI